MVDYKVLLIDYEPKSIERIVRPLESVGFSVEVATDGLSGLEAFERNKPHLVIIEAMIPKKHGFEVCQEIKKTTRGKRTPVIITTAVYKGRKYRHQGLHIYGCDEYVEKPIPEKELIDLARRLVGGAPPEPVAVAAARETQAVVAQESTPEPRPVAAPLASVAVAPSTPPKPRSQPTAVSAIVGDLTEQEIMARLDALLPSDPFGGDDESLSNVISSLSKSPSETAPEIPRGEAAQEAVENLSGLDRSFHLPDDLAEIPASSDPANTADPAAGAQVVSFEPARSRRSKRPGSRREDAASAAPFADEIAAEPPSATAPSSPAVAHAAASAASKPPRVVSTPLPSPSPKSKLPVWVWGVVAVALIGVAYLFFFRTAPTSSAPFDPAPQVRPEGRGEPARDSGIEPPVPAAAGTVDGGAEVYAPRPEPPKSEAAPTVPAVGSDASAKRASPSTTTAPPSPSPNRATDAHRPAQKAAPAAVSAPAHENRPVPTTTSSTPEPVPAAPVEVEKKPAEADPKPAESQAAPAVAPDTKDPPVHTPTIESPEEPPPSQLQEKLSTTDLATKPLLAEQVDVSAVAVSRPLPPYTAQARLLRQEGRVVIRVLVDETGRVVDSQLVSGIPGSDLNGAVLRTARSWVYRPARKLGVPVKQWKTEEVVFKR